MEGNRLREETAGAGRHGFPRSVLTNDDWRERLSVDWKWSSVRYDLLNPPWQPFAEFPFIQGPPPGPLD